MLCCQMLYHRAVLHSCNLQLKHCLTLQCWAGLHTTLHQFSAYTQGAGYRSNPRGRFDPLNQAASGGGSPLDAKIQASPEEQCLEAEAKVHIALEQSAEALVKGDASAGSQILARACICYAYNIKTDRLKDCMAVTSLSVLSVVSCAPSAPYMA